MERIAQNTGVRNDGWRVTLNAAEETHYRATHTATSKVGGRSLPERGTTNWTFPTCRLSKFGSPRAPLARRRR
jgi:hypothetical protein